MEPKMPQTGQQPISIEDQDDDISEENDEAYILAIPPAIPPEPMPPAPPPPPPRKELGTGVWINLTNYSLECVRDSNPTYNLLNTLSYMLLVETSTDISMSFHRNFRAKAWKWFEQALFRFEHDTEQFIDGNELFNFLFYTTADRSINHILPMPIKLKILEKLMPFIQRLSTEQKQEVFSWTRDATFPNGSRNTYETRTNVLFVVIHTFYQYAHRVIGYPYSVLNSDMKEEYSAGFKRYSSILQQLISQIDTLPEASQGEVYSHLFPTEDFQPRDDEHNHSQNFTMMPYDIIRTVIYIYSALYDKDSDNNALLAFSKHVKRFSGMAVDWGDDKGINLFRDSLLFAIKKAVYPSIIEPEILALLLATLPVEVLKSSLNELTMQDDITTFTSQPSMFDNSSKSCHKRFLIEKIKGNIFELQPYQIDAVKKVLKTKLIDQIDNVESDEESEKIVTRINSLGHILNYQNPCFMSQATRQFSSFFERPVLVTSELMNRLNFVTAVGNEDHSSFELESKS